MNQSGTRSFLDLFILAQPNLADRVFISVTGVYLRAGFFWVPICSPPFDRFRILFMKEYHNIPNARVFLNNDQSNSVIVSIPVEIMGWGSPQHNQNSLGYRKI